ncbi:hypothetical protein [uncultured Megasphaera sp.]|uniref:hypothetical protein n=1 Tax=uncultured Megasphaera sp. TaxID=165188 RepID=UPI00260088CE|nr:hypothetical protein [uncultured Megasphaera sp.]
MYYEEIICNTVDKYKNLHNGEVMTANRIDADVLESVIRKPHVSPKNHADFLQMDYDRVMQVLRYFGINSKERRELMNRALNDFAEILYQHLNEQQTPEREKQWKSSLQGILNSLRHEWEKMTRGFYLMSLFKFCSDMRYRSLFPTRQTWIQDLSAIEAKNFFRDIDYEINRQEKAFDFTDLNEMINDSVQETNLKDDEEETLEDKIQNLEFELQTTRSTLQFVQRSFDDMVKNITARSEAAKEEAVNEFFIQLNSERYGRLLDNSVLVEKKLELLRKEKYHFPMQVMTLPILLRNFTNFIKACGFQPIDTVGRTFEAGADDLMYVVYEGEPFVGDEKKTVQVVSPGWKKGDAVISKTVVREVIE